MFKDYHPPSHFSFISKGKVFLLLNNEYKDLLLREGIDEIGSFLERKSSNSKILTGRKGHPSIPIEKGTRMVVRRYSHGGLFGALTGGLYLFGSRPFQELALTEEIRSHGIMTVQSIGAIHQVVFGPFYRACFLSLEIPEAKDLTRLFQEIGLHPSSEILLQKRKLIRLAALLLKSFHQAGFFHRDLQLKNILIANNQPLLIDFDRSYQRPALSITQKMKNLLRLNRSVEKWKRFGLPITRTDRWRFFLAYAGNDIPLRKAIGRTIRTYRLRLLFYRLGWNLQKVLTRRR
jgi:serine/threonine protein kinase